MRDVENVMTFAPGLDITSQYPGCGYTCVVFFRVEGGAGGRDHDPRVAFLIGIGTPLEKYDFSFLAQCRKPLLLVHGEHDEFGDVERLRELVAELEKSVPVR
jgi:hypothetical protein